MSLWRKGFLLYQGKRNKTRGKQKSVFVLEVVEKNRGNSLVPEEKKEKKKKENGIGATTSWFSY